jgi:catechol 2,3-dioxygenase-like lactoylglutathione lyase family enzyme
MQVKHIALVCRKEADADWFFGEFLKLEKSERKAIPGSLTLPLFGVHGGLDAFNYTGHGLHFEIFIHDDPQTSPDRIAHTCLAVERPEALLERAESLTVTVLRVPRGDGWVTFFKDRDGHLFEIK